MATPTLSILMTLSNVEATLEEAIRSLPAGCSDVQRIAVVNGSSDRTLEIARAMLDGPRDLVLSTRFPGLPYARNLARRHAKGKYIAIMDGDDISTPDRFERHIQFLDGNPDIDVVGGQVEMFDVEGRLCNPELFTTPEQVEADTLFRVPLFMGAGLMRRLAVSYPPMPMAGDWWQLWQVMRAGRSAVNLPFVSLRYRQHTQNVTNTMRRAPGALCPTVLLRAEFLGASGVSLDDDELLLFADAARTAHRLFEGCSALPAAQVAQVERLYEKVQAQNKLLSPSALRAVCQWHLAKLR